MTLSRRIATCVAATALFVGLLASASMAASGDAGGSAAGSGSVKAAAAPVCVNDAAADNNWGFDPNGDILSYCVSNDGSTVTASVTTKSFDDPSTSYNWRAWQQGDPVWIHPTRLIFSLDTNSDSAPEYDVFFVWSASAGTVISYVTPYAQPNVIRCNATPTWNAGTSTYTSSIPAACVGGQSVLGLTASMYYETATTISQDVTSFISTGCSGHEGYWLLGQDGGIFSFGSAPFYGSTGNLHLNQPVVGMASAPDASGYWFVASDGGIFSYGPGAAFYGSTGSITLNQPIVGMAARPQGDGYWMVASDGGIFSFGNAKFYGSTGSITLNQPIVGMAVTPSGNGYWMVARDGGIFAFGDAGFYGSTGGISLVQPIVGMTSVQDGQGYWMVAADGGIFTFGPNARFAGSATNSPSTIVGMSVAAFTDGYRLANVTGGVASFNAPNCGSLSGQQLAAPIVAIATAAPPL